MENDLGIPTLAHRNLRLKVFLKIILVILFWGAFIGDFAQGAEPPAAAASTNAPAAQPTRTRAWWRDGGLGRRVYSTDSKKLPLIAVKGNKFVHAQGNTVLFRGLSTSDPDKLEMQGHWNREHFAKAKEMGAKLVRIPIHPAAWRERTPPEYMKLLDQAVEWCTDLEMYIVLDWHSIGNLKTGVFQAPMYDTSQQETYNFWHTMARHYAGHNTVAFFELFNEPTTFNNQLGPISWEDWKRIVEEEIGIIRANNPQAIPLVAGFDWAYDLTPLRLSPIAAESIGYTVHPYANKRSQPWEPKWEEDFGFAAARYPIIATEFGGFAMPAAVGAQPTAADAGAGSRAAVAAAYGPAIIKFLEGKGISWTVWCFDPEWGPSLLRNWDYQFNASGEFARAALRGELK
jgi:aryl-phospho-beta-D-glucosidase BglC (GH1 family)